jgi:DNA-directed RNA polymerase specialized sigma54-like protein
MAVIESLKPKGVTSADISELMKTILSNSGQPAAQKLQQLSDLRYQRLLTDEEFEAAKAKVLGI